MRTLLAAAILCFAIPVHAQDGHKIERLSADAFRSVSLADLQWADAPMLEKGAKVAVLAGDPGQAGVFMLYLKFPPNFKVAPHSHPFTEVVTVIKGKVGNGLGETFAPEKGELLETGSSFTLPADTAHYLWNEHEAVILLTATGPFGVTYVNPSEDPRNK